MFLQSARLLKLQTSNPRALAETTLELRLKLLYGEFLGPLVVILLAVRVEKQMLAVGHLLSLID